MGMITQQQAIDNATKSGGMTVADWIDLIDSVTFNDHPSYSRQALKDYATEHNGLFGSMLRSFLRSCALDGDPIATPAFVSWVGTEQNGFTEWYLTLKSIQFGGGGGVPLSGVFTVPFKTQFE